VSVPARFDVAIIGAGIAGSALALALSGRGLAIALVEAQPLPGGELPGTIDLHAFDPRVSALTPRSRELLERLGAWAAIDAYRQCPYGHMTVWDGEGTGRIDFDSADVDVPALGYIVENRVITRALTNRIHNARDIRLFIPASLETVDPEGPQGVRLALACGEQLVAELLVAADGAQSRVRELLDFRTREWDYGQRAIVATVELEHPHRDTAWQVFLPTGPLAFLPLPGGRFCSIVWSLDDAGVEGRLALDDGAFCAELERVFESRLGRVLACSRRFAFPLRQRHAVDYIRPGVALVADAAHTIHPLAGQGINLGLQDVMVLAEEVLAGRERGVSPGALELLRRYQRRRKGENLAMMAAMEGFRRLFGQSAPPLRWLRNTGLGAVGRIEPLKRQLMRHAMGL